MRLEKQIDFTQESLPYFYYKKIPGALGVTGGFFSVELPFGYGYLIQRIIVSACYKVTPAANFQFHVPQFRITNSRGTMFIGGNDGSGVDINLISSPAAGGDNIYNFGYGGTGSPYQNDMATMGSLRPRAIPRKYEKSVNLYFPAKDTIFVRFNKGATMNAAGAYGVYTQSQDFEFFFEGRLIPSNNPAGGDLWAI